MAVWLPFSFEEKMKVPKPSLKGLLYECSY
jgi:hypothetical protein